MSALPAKKETDETMSFDTLKFAETLKSSGFTAEQANALTKAQQNVIAESLLPKTATKTDLTATEMRLKTEIYAVETRLKTEIAEVKNQLKTEIHAVESRLKTEMYAFKVDIIKWMLGLSFAQFAVMVGILIKVL